MASAKRKERQNGRNGRELTGRQLRRLAAKQVGATVFESDTPCKKCGTTTRRTQSNNCIACKRVVDREYIALNAEAHRERAKKSARSRPDAVRAYQKSYYEENKEVATERARLWVIDHKEHVAIRRAKYAETNRDRLLAEKRRYYAENKEKCAAAARRFREQNRHKKNAAENAREARKRGLQVGDRKAYAAFLKWAYSTASVKCHWCKKKTAANVKGKTNRHVDHVIPLSKGGPDAVANLCVTCPSCNLHKQAKLPEHFAASGQSELKLA